MIYYRNVGGVFLLLLGGCLVALLIAIIEFSMNVQKVAINEKVKVLRWFDQLFGSRLQERSNKSFGFGILFSQQLLFN